MKKTGVSLVVTGESLLNGIRSFEKYVQPIIFCDVTSKPFLDKVDKLSIGRPDCFLVDVDNDDLTTEINTINLVRAKQKIIQEI